MSSEASAIAPSDSVQATHDVVIVGGGLVGASLAIVLQGQGLDIAMVEATPPGALPAVFDQRNLSLAEASVNALVALGVWPLLRAPTGPIRRIHVSRAGDFGAFKLDACDVGREAFGQVVVARDFGEALEARLQQFTQLTRYRPARFIGTTPSGEGLREIRLDTDAGERRLHTRLLVAADGADSSVRSALGIGVDIEDYAQTLFVARLRGERTPDGSAYERLTDSGPTALLPRGDGHYGLVHGVAAGEVDEIAALDDAAFLARVQTAFGWRAGRFTSIGPRSTYPIRRVIARALTAPAAVLVGNAAQSMHPIGAQGFNLGLRDALVLAESIQRHGLVPDMPEAYAQRRHEDRQRTLAFSDGLARWTSNPTPLASTLRTLGMGVAANSPTLQAWLVGGAMGYRGDVPALCRGAA